MKIDSGLTQMARSLPKIQRKNILMNFKETRLHAHLKELFSRMETEYLVEITHGVTEFGKDLVIAKRDSLSTDIIAVIVKVGNIKGKTLGDADDVKTQVKDILSSIEEKKIAEIESQIDQALKHPAELKTVFARLPVSKIIIILAGEISSNARTRIEGEFPRGITIYDINWLIENFTDYYPQVYFEARAVDFLQEKIDYLESSDWISKSRDKNLSEYYVDPLIQEAEAPVTATKQGISLKNKNRFHFSEILSKTKTTSKVIVCGDPGSGKSNALSKLAIDRYRDAYKQTTKGGPINRSIRIPLLVSARDLLKLENEKELKNYCSLNSEIENHFIVDLLMVDALDEVPPENREKVIEKAQSCCSSLNCKLIVASRKIDIIDHPPKSFKKYDLLPFELGQALKLFKKLVKNESSLNALKEGLNRIKFQIPMVPLSLMLLSSLLKNEKKFLLQ